MTQRQVEELKQIEPWSREFGAAAFARRHGMTVPSVYHWRKKLGLPVAKWCGRVALLLLAVRAAHADVVPIEWNFPTTLADGSGLVNPTEIDYSLVRWGRCGDGGPWEPPALHIQVKVPRPAGTPATTPPPRTTSIDFGRGVKWCVQVAVVTFGGLASPWSATIREVYIEQPGPAAPTLVLPPPPPGPP